MSEFEIPSPPRWEPIFDIASPIVVNVPTVVIDFANEDDNRMNAIRLSAYYKWVDAGCPNGRHDEFWLEAENEWEQGYVYLTDDSLIA